MLPFTESVLQELLNEYPAPHPVCGLAAASLEGDTDAQVILYDLLEEEGALKSPFVVGQSYLINLVTLYYVGRVTEIGFGYLVLENASWVHWTGRLSELLKKQDFRKVTSRKPRTEYCGQVIIMTNSGVSAYPWRGPLPEGCVE